MLETIGYEPRMARWATARDASLGRVAHVDRGLATVLTRIGPVRATIGGSLLTRMGADYAEGPCTGDWCVLRTWPDHRLTIERILPRRTAVVRAASGRRTHDQVLCANLDICAVVVGLHPPPEPADVERLVAHAADSGARPLLVLTKSDLVDNPRRLAADVCEGVDAVAVSSRTKDGVDALRARLEGRLTMALVGAAGQGKSSLTRALVGAEVLGARLSGEAGRRRGRPARREMVPLPDGGVVIDTLGIPWDERRVRSTG